MSSPESRIWRVTVDDLIRIFRRGLLDLIPVMDDARIEWRSDPTYDDFDRIAEALYDSIVRDSVANAKSHQTAIPLARYGIGEPGRELSRILVNDPADRLAFYQFQTNVQPFDTMLCIRVSDDGREVVGETSLPSDGQRFAYAARYDGTKSFEFLYEVDVLL